MSHKVALSFADGKTLFVSATEQENLLLAALRHGIKLPSDCGEGVCGTCKGTCEAGKYSIEYADEDALSEQERAQRGILACQTMVKSDASFYFDFDFSLCNAEQTPAGQAVVTQVKLISATTAVLYLQAQPGTPPLNFLPGQYARLRIPGTDTCRSYSFAHAPNSVGQMQFLIRLLPQGAMSEYIRERAKADDIIEFEAPLGTFYLREVHRPLYLMAGGTGLSAFLGMLDEMAAQGYCAHPVTLFYGVNDSTDLCEMERLNSYKTSIPGFDFHPVVVNGTPEWTGKQGFITQHLAQEEFLANPFDMYVCGPPPMVEAIKTWFADAGIDNFTMYFEKFVDSNLGK